LKKIIANGFGPRSQRLGVLIRPTANEAHCYGKLSNRSIEDQLAVPRYRWSG
jgi:hypothetical protein